MYNNTRILISGGTGSWGKELVNQLLPQKPKEIVIYSRNEFLQVSMERQYKNPILKFVIGDIRDYDPLLSACKGIDYIFHLAAAKHVPVCEIYPNEAIKTNITGTQNIIKAAIANKVLKVIDCSTDKACAASTLYGLTKAVGEKLILNADKLSSHTRFSITRAGNVLGSNGSVLGTWINQIKEQNKVTVTSKEMTRYFITLKEAISLLFLASEFKQSGGIFVLKMPACRILDLAEVLISHYGNATTKIEEIGIRQCEKIHEVLISQDESPNAYCYTDKFYFIHNENLGFPRVPFKEYASNTKIMNKAEIKTLLINGGFII